MNKYKYKSEAEFGEQFVKLLRKLGFETWQEVYLAAYHYCSTPCVDVIARLKNVYFAFELKLTLNDHVLEQARNNQGFVDYSYAVVPMRKKSSVTEVKKHYMKHFGIGVLFLDPKEFLERNFARNSEQDVLTAVLHDGSLSARYFSRLVGYDIFAKAKRKYKRKIFKKGKNKGKRLIETFLYNEQKECEAGTKEGERSTPFKRSCAKIYNYLQQHPEASKKEVWTALKDDLHWASYASMYGSFRAFGHLDIMQKIKWRD